MTLLSLVASSVGAWILVVIGADAPSGPAVPWGLAAGLGAAIGATALDRGYGHGQMAVAGPLSAVGAAALPAVVGVLLGDRLPWVGIVGIVLAIPAIWLMSRSSGPTVRVRTGVGRSPVGWRVRPGVHRSRTRRRHGRAVAGSGLAVDGARHERPDRRQVAGLVLGAIAVTMVLAD